MLHQCQEEPKESTSISIATQKVMKKKKFKMVEEQKVPYEEALKMRGMKSLQNEVWMEFIG